MIHFSKGDTSFTYMLCSTIDDMDYHVSHIIRGDDHISNTAIQIQLFQVLGSQIPACAHMGLVKTKDSKISKEREVLRLRQEIRKV